MPCANAEDFGDPPMSVTQFSARLAFTPNSDHSAEIQDRRDFVGGYWVEKVTYPDHLRWLEQPNFRVDRQLKKLRGIDKPKNRMAHLKR